MSTNPDPTPVNPTPVDPDLASSWVDPTPVETPLAADAVPGPAGVPLADEPTPPAPGPVPEPGHDEHGHAGPAREEVRRRAAETAAAMRESDLKAIYAAAGATQVIVGAVRETVTETSRWASARISELRFRRAELAKQAEEMRQRAEGLPEEVKAVPEAARTRAADLQQQATGTYSELANRGQRALHDVRTDVVNRIDPAFDKLAERLEAARRAIRGAAVQTPAPPVPPVAEPPVPAPAAPVAESAVPSPAAPVVDVPDAVVVEDVTPAPVTEPGRAADEDTHPER